MDEQEKREKEFKEWQEACATAIAQASSNRPPDTFIRATIYNRNMKGGIFKVRDAPLEKGIEALLEFTEMKIQPNGKGGRKRDEKKNNEKAIPNLL